MKIKQYIIGAGLLLLLVWSCTNPFSTRTPEEPDTGGGRPSFNLQNDPDSLLAKLRASFALENVTYYQECFADSFQVNQNLVFIPENREMDRLNNWTLTDEINYFNNLINAQDLQNINIEFRDLSDWVQTPTSSDTQQVQFSYQITLQFRTKTEDYQGRSLVKILRSSASLWYIFHWEDFSNANGVNETWSTLKADYRYGQP